MLSPDYYVIELEKFAQCSNQNDLGNCFQKFCKKFFKTARRLTDRCYVMYHRYVRFFFLKNEMGPNFSAIWTF